MPITFLREQLTPKSAVFRVSEDPLLLLQIQLASCVSFDTSKADQDLPPDAGLKEVLSDEKDEVSAEADTDPIMLACMTLPSVAAGSGVKGAAALSGKKRDDAEDAAATEGMDISEFYFMREADPTAPATRGDDDDDDEADQGWFYFASITRKAGVQELSGQTIPISLKPGHRPVQVSAKKIVSSLGAAFGLDISCHFTMFVEEARPQ